MSNEFNLGQNKPKVNLSLKDGEVVKCECGGVNWLPVVRFFKFSRLLTGQPKDSIAPIDLFICGICGKACQDMLPNDLKDEQPPENVISLDFTPKQEPKTA